MTRILVIGAGMGGLATALFCARRGHAVTVLERDDQPKPDATADEDFHDWQRVGVPHARQGHNFLGLSSRVMQEEAPDVLDAVAARGVPRIPVPGDEKDENLLSRRLVYEGALRRTVEAEPGVQVWPGTSVERLVVRGEIQGVPRIVGVRLSDGAEIGADLVVDTAGRRARPGRWLVEAGCRPPVETAQPCGFHYLTQHFRMREGESFPQRTVPIYAKLDYTKLVVFAADNGCFQVSMTVATDDPLRHCLREPGVYRSFLETVPLTAPWMGRSEPMDEPHPMARLEDRWRRLVSQGSPIAAGYILLGDAAMQTNPAFGRGVSLAFRQAQRLARTVAAAPADPAGYTVQLDAWAERDLGVWFNAQLASSREQREHIEAGVRGESVAPSANRVGQFLDALAILSEDHPDINVVQLRFFNMLMTPDELLNHPIAARWVHDYIRDHGDPVVPARGPDRAEFERLVTS